MTTRETLALAAKAAGIEVAIFRDDLAYRVYGGYQTGTWEPTIHSNDSLELMLRCGLSIAYDTDTMSVTASGNGVSFTQPDVGGYLHTARMAVFNAVVEMGRALP